MRQANGLDEFYSRTFGDGSCELFLDLTDNLKLANALK
jgi:hypothetical protein